MKIRKLLEIFKEIETVVEYTAYYYNVSKAITIAVLGSLCGLKNVSQLYQWVESEKTREFLKEKFAIERIACLLAAKFAEDDESQIAQSLLDAMDNS